MKERKITKNDNDRERSNIRSSNKIVSFQKEKQQIEFNNSKYEGSVYIYIEGESFEKARYSYYLEYIEEDELEDFLLVILNSLIGEVLKDGKSLKIKEPTEPLLNKEITIDFYSSRHTNNKFFFEHTPADITYTQLIVILNSCIANLRQQ